MNLTVNGQDALFGLSRNEFSLMMAPIAGEVEVSMHIAFCAPGSP